MFCANCGSAVADDAKFCRQCGKPTAPTAPPPPRQPAYSSPFPNQARPAPIGKIYAGFWRRVLAYGLDYFVLTLAIGACLAGVAVVSGAKDSPLWALGFLVVPLLYYVILESSGLQGTLGKKALGIKVTDEVGDRVSAGRALGRFLGKILSGLTLGVGFAMAGFTAKRQALHDMVSGSLVVRSIADPTTIAQSTGDPRGGGYIAAMVILMMLFGPFGIGMLAAIAIPAYQNYTIRSQVTEGLMLGDGWKTAVAEFYADKGRWPTAADVSSNSASVGKYEKSVGIEQGAVVIVYGGQANAKINGKRIVLSPGVNSNNDVVWVCGSATPPDGLDLAVDSAKYTTVEPQYLPQSCHS